MATIRKRGSKWEAQVRRKGWPSVSRSFHMKADAQAWARGKERELDTYEAGTARPPSKASKHEGHTLRELVVRYLAEVTPRKRGAPYERYRLNSLLKLPLMATRVSDLAGSTFAAHRDQRLRQVSGSTVRRELRTIGHVLEIARREWGYDLPSNPVRQIAIPSEAPSRTRRLEPGERDRLDEALAASKLPYLRPFVHLAIETGMRRGELLSLRWRDIDLALKVAQLRETKNGHPRSVPLTPNAVAILESLDRDSDRVFPVSPNALRLSWERLRVKAKLTDLRLHDLRHEAVSHFFELGLSVPEVAVISGHRDPRMLARYTHLRPTDIADKLAVLTRQNEAGTR